MWQLLLTHGAYVLATGDPGQLPPVDKDADNHVLDTPHIFLDEIMRQAQDSEIIRLSMWVREGKILSQFPVLGEQVQIVDSNSVVDGMYEWADQILCATNSKRHEINNFVR
jgi:exodeoxyribonuclease-5